MATHVDMSLDDIIKSRKRSERGRGQGRPHRGRAPGGSFSGPRMAGPVRRGPLAVNTRPSAYIIAKSFNRTRSFPWQHDLFEDSLRAAGISGIEVGIKLYVSNLHHGVTNEDIRELFSEIGELKRYAIHYDNTGRPSGSAEVVYNRRSDAFVALKRYNNVLLDGKPMKIEVVGTNTEGPISARVNATGMNGRRKRTVVMTSGPGRVGGPVVINRGFGQYRRGGMNRGGMSRGGMRNSGSLDGGRGQGRGRGNRGGRGGGGSRGGRGGGGKKRVEKSADDLDKELDKYHAESMQT